MHLVVIIFCPWSVSSCHEHDVFQFSNRFHPSSKEMMCHHHLLNVPLCNHEIWVIFYWPTISHSPTWLRSVDCGWPCWPKSSTFSFYWTWTSFCTFHPFPSSMAIWFLTSRFDLNLTIYPDFQIYCHLSSLILSSHIFPSFWYLDLSL